MDMTAFARNLEAGSATQWIQQQAWLIPTLQSIHILAVAVVFASSLLFAVRLGGLAGSNDPISTAADRYLAWAWRVLPVLLLTGLIQITGEPVRELTNWAFWTKMALVALVVLAMSGLRRGLGGETFDQLAAPVRSRNRVAALLLVVALVLIIVAGRWIAYVQ